MPGWFWQRWKASAGFWLRSGLSVTSLLHGHKRNYDNAIIGTSLPTKALSSTGLLLLFFIGLDSLLFCSSLFKKRSLGRFIFLPNNLHSKKAP